MGVSFKIAKVGSRYRPKVLPQPPDLVTASDEAREYAGGAEEVKKSDREVSGCHFFPRDSVSNFVAAIALIQVNMLRLGRGFDDHSVYSANCEEHRASFSLNLFPNGFSVGKPTEGMLLPLVEDSTQSLLPYDRVSMTLFSAIEYGWLPGDIFDDLQCKYLNGTVLCEVWDYRKCLSKLGNNDDTEDEFPNVQKIRLRMGMENVVKDLPSILDDRFSYNDLMEIESRITRALQPELFLSPDPFLIGLYSPFRRKLDLGICEWQLTREQNDVPEVNPHSTNVSRAKHISRNECFCTSESWIKGVGTFCSDQCTMSISMPIGQQNDMTNVSEPALPAAFSTDYKPRFHCSSALDKIVVAANSVLATDHNVKNCNTVLQGSVFRPEKKDRCELQLMQEPSLKRQKQDNPVPRYFQHSFSQRVGLFEREPQNVAPSEAQIGAETMMQPSFGNAKSPQSKLNETALVNVPNLEEQTLSFIGKGEAQCSINEALPKTKILRKAEVELYKEGYGLRVERDTINQQPPFSSVTSLPSQMQCVSTGLSVEKFAKKENKSQKRKSAETGDSVRHHVSELGENHRISSRAPYRSCTNVTKLGCCLDSSLPPVSIVNISLGSDIINYLDRENQMPQNTQKRSQSHSKKSTNTSDTRSSAIGSANNAQICSNSSSKGSMFLKLIPEGEGDLNICERFSKIVSLVARHELSKGKKRAGENLTGKLTCHFPLTPMMDLLMPEDVEDCRSLMDNTCLSKFLIGGKRNICKTRIMTFVRVRHSLRGNIYPFAVVDSWKLVLFESEKTDDHEVRAEAIFGDKECVPIAVLPSLHHADLFAAQFISLMEEDGYELKSDEIQPALTRFTDAFSSISVHIDSFGDAEFSCASSEAGSPKQITSFISRISIRNPEHLMSPQNVCTPSGDPPACFDMGMPKQMDVIDYLGSIEQHCFHDQRSIPSFQGNLFSNSHLQMGNQLSDSSISPCCFQWQQYKHQHHQRQKVLLSEMFSLGATCNGSRLELTGPHTGDNLGQNFGFCQFAVNFISGGKSQVEATPTAKPRQESIEGVMDAKNLLDRTRESSCIGQLHFTNTTWEDPSNHFDVKNHGYPKQVHISKQDKKPRVCWQRQEPVGSPVQDGAQNMTRMSMSTAVSSREPSSGPCSHQESAVLADELSPQLSS